MGVGYRHKIDIDIESHHHSNTVHYFALILILSKGEDILLKTDFYCDRSGLSDL